VVEVEVEVAIVVWVCVADIVVILVFDEEKIQLGNKVFYLVIHESMNNWTVYALYTHSIWSGTSRSEHAIEPMSNIRNRVEVVNVIFAPAEGSPALSPQAFQKGQHVDHMRSVSPHDILYANKTLTRTS
jgi:hypothetical protein